MSENKSHIEISKGSERSFGIVFALFFLAVSLYPLLFQGTIRLWSFTVAVFFLIFSLLAPKIFTLPNRLWFKFGIFLGSIIAPVVMLIVYFLTIVPTGFIMRLMRKDLLSEKLDKNTESYWIVRDNPVGSMKDQF